MMPGNAKKRHPIVEERTRKLAEYAETSPLNREETGGTWLGIITASTSYQYVKEVFGDSVSVLKLGMTNPLPENLIKNFAKKVERLVVVEELDPVIEEAVRAMGIKVEGRNLLPGIDEFSQNKIRAAFGKNFGVGESLEDAIPPRPPVMCAGCPHRGLFYTLKKLNCTVLGDIGCYTLGAVPPLAAMDMTLCMGASIGALHGFTKVNNEAAKNTVAVIGDSTFVHSGMTGHQQNPATGKNIKGEPAGRIDLEALCRAMGINRVRVADPYNLKEIEAAVKEELSVDEASVIISRRPCALLKEVKHKAPLKVDKDKCIGCKSCMKIGCPAISMKDKKAVVDANQCVGCGVCAGLCPKNAFSGVEG